MELMIAAISAVSLLIGAVLSYLATRGKTESEATQVTRRDTLEDRDNLIAILQTSIDSVREEVKEYRLEVNELRAEVGEVRTHNNALVSFVYKMLAVFRKYGLDHEIPDPRPEGIDFD